MLICHVCSKSSDICYQCNNCNIALHKNCALLSTQCSIIKQLNGFNLPCTYCKIGMIYVKDSEAVVITRKTRENARIELENLLKYANNTASSIKQVCIYICNNLCVLDHQPTLRDIVLKKFDEFEPFIPEIYMYRKIVKSYAIS